MADMRDRIKVEMNRFYWSFVTRGLAQYELKLIKLLEKRSSSEVAMELATLRGIKDTINTALADREAYEAGVAALKKSVTP